MHRENPVMKISATMQHFIEVTINLGHIDLPSTKVIQLHWRFNWLNILLLESVQISIF